MILEQYNREMDADREDHDKLLVEMRKSIPEHQKILGLLHDRDEQSKQIVRMDERMMEFGILRQQIVNSPCVRMLSSIIEPGLSSDQPNRPLLDRALGFFCELWPGDRPGLPAGARRDHSRSKGARTRFAGA